MKYLESWRTIHQEPYGAGIDPIDIGDEDDDGLIGQEVVV